MSGGSNSPSLMRTMNNRLTASLTCSMVTRFCAEKNQQLLKATVVEPKDLRFTHLVHSIPNPVKDIELVRATVFQASAGISSCSSRCDRVVRIIVCQHDVLCQQKMHDISTVNRSTYSCMHEQTRSGHIYQTGQPLFFLFSALSIIIENLLMAKISGSMFFFGQTYIHIKDSIYPLNFRTVHKMARWKFFSSTFECWISTQE